MNPNGKPNFNDILCYALIQQGEKLAEDMVRSTKQKIHHLIQFEILQLVKSEQNLRKRADLYKKFEPLLCDFAMDSPYLEFGQPLELIPTLSVLKAYLQKQKELLNRCCGTDYPEMKASIRTAFKSVCLSRHSIIASNVS